MPDGWVWAALVGYALGSMSAARLVARRRLRGEDLSTTSYDVGGLGFSVEARGVSPGSVGARAGARAGGLATLGDIAKAAVAVGAVWAWLGRDAAAVAGAGAVLGHVAPIQHRFRGAFGQSPIIGAALVLSPLSIPFAVVAAAGASWALAEVVIGTTLWTLFLIAWGWWRDDPTFVWFAVAANAIYLTRVAPQLAQRVRFRRTFRPDARARWGEILHTYRSKPFDPPAETSSGGDAPD